MPEPEGLRKIREEQEAERRMKGTTIERRMRERDEKMRREPKMGEDIYK